ncbi:ABC transporter substrate-binding protein [uncultured Amnibacterium sp.]|uniref:ABC transporter substrate-binding protein n=1 Tax=uncultured Amnibacterium sp. TaxID=1631851 RepID=UPI0035C99CBF
MKRTVASVALLGAAALVLTGCAGGGSAGGPGSASGPVTLTFWHGYTADDGKKLNQIIDEFNESQKQVTVKYQVKTWQVIGDSLLPALAAKKAPQLIALPAEQLPVYAGKGAFADLSGYYAGSAAAKTIKPETVAMEEVGGKQYGVPTGFVPLSVIYNKKLFKAAGIDTFPTTWDEWLADAKKLTIDKNGDGTPEQYGLALPDHATVGNGVWASLFYGNGGAIAIGTTAQLDSPANVQTLTYWADAVRKDKISPTGLDGIKSDNLFASGKAAMEVGGPWMTFVAADNKIDSGVAAIPAGPKGAAASAIGVSMGVSSQATDAEKKGAEQFFDYFYSKKVAAQWSLGSGWPPLTTNVAASDVASNPLVASLTDIAAKGTKPLLPGVIKSSDALAAVDEATQKALAGQDPATVLKASQPVLQEALSAK